VSESISYDHKFGDRTALTDLFSQRGDCDDILVIKAGCVTDSYVANVVFWDGEGWFTSDTPLLAGTMRASLLDTGIVKEVRIMQKDLARYQKLRLINAFNDLSGGIDIPMEAISQ
jgi:4-amino-4-deoxychorismate lyase